MKPVNTGAESVALESTAVIVNAIVPISSILQTERHKTLVNGGLHQAEASHSNKTTTKRAPNIP
jgi:hypothetical protein